MRSFFLKKAALCWGSDDSDHWNCVVIGSMAISSTYTGGNGPYKAIFWGISPYIALIYGRHLQLGFLKYLKWKFNETKEMGMTSRFTRKLGVFFFTWGCLIKIPQLNPVDCYLWEMMINHWVANQSALVLGQRCLRFGSWKGAPNKMFLGNQWGSLLGFVMSSSPDKARDTPCTRQI